MDTLEIRILEALDETKSRESERVASDARVAPTVVGKTLADLVDRGLVSADTDDRGTERFKLNRGALLDQLKS